MNKHIKSLALLISILAVGGGAAVSLQAQELRTGESGPTHGSKHQPPTSIIFNRKLVSTTQSYGEPGTSEGASFVAIDSPLAFICPAGGCTVSAEQNVQLSGSVAGNRWAICTAVDGNYMDQPDCPYLGYVSSDGSYLAGSFVQNMSGVTAGKHTLQTFLYTDDGATLSIYNIVYRLYTP